MKSILLSVLLSCLTLSALAKEAKSHLVIWVMDGSKVAYALNEKPKVTFSDSEMVITANGMEVNYPLDNLARFSYESDTDTTVRNLKTGRVAFRLEGESLLFPGLEANSSVSIHDLNGMQVFKKTVRTTGEYYFSLSDLNSGVYIITVNSTTYKIIKR